MNSRFNLVVFDIDGTLLDTEDMIYNIYKHNIQHHNLSPKTKEEITANSLVLYEQYKRLFPDIDVTELVATHKKFTLEFLHLAKTFANTIDTLQTLKDAKIRIGAQTNRGSHSMIKTLELAKIDGYFDKLITPDDVEKGKPDPMGVNEMIEEFGTTKEKTIMVGDSLVDIETGKNAGITTVGVTYGWHGKNIANAKPDFTVNDIKEILQLIIA